MSTTIKTIGRRIMIPPNAVSIQSRASKLVAEWQQRGPETLSGHALRKLRLVLAPSQSATFAGAVA